METNFTFYCLKVLESFRNFSECSLQRVLQMDYCNELLEYRIVRGIYFSLGENRSFNVKYLNHSSVENLTVARWYYISCFWKFTYNSYQTSQFRLANAAKFSEEFLIVKIYIRIHLVLLRVFLERELFICVVLLMFGCLPVIH